jgi:hypothetical protein
MGMAMDQDQAQPFAEPESYTRSLADKDVYEAWCGGGMQEITDRRQTDTEDRQR